MIALLFTLIVLGVGLYGPADGLTARINRAVYRIVGTATPLAIGALLTNLGVIGGVS